MRKALLPLIAALLSSHAWADEAPQWIEIASTNSNEWQGKLGSGLNGTLDKEKAVLYVMQRTPKDKKESVAYSKVYVSLADCQRGYGTYYENSLDNEFRQNGSFVRGGETVGDAIGMTGCNTAAALGHTVQQSAFTWKLAASSVGNDTEYSLAPETIRTVAGKSEKSYLALLKIYQTGKKTTQYEEVTIGSRACKEGLGRMKYDGLDGKNKSSGDYVKSGSAINSAIGDAICASFG